MTEKATREKSPRLLAALEGQFRPRRYHREATLRPKTPLPTQLLDQVTRTLPGWQWEAPNVPPTEELVHLDGNGAWIAGASSVRIAMEQLEHTGPMPIEQFAKERMPGYYQIKVWHQIHPTNQYAAPVDQDPTLDLFSWSDPRFCSPLGRSRDGFVWVCEPTLKLLLELQHKDQWWSELTIFDSWTPETKTDLHDWTSWVDAQRLELKTRPGQEGERARDAFKLAYAQAVQMLPGAVDKETGKDKCLVKRPDWYHAIISQHRANQWRKAWNAIDGARVEIVRVGGNDEIHVTKAGYDLLVQLQDTGRPPIGLHATKLGKYDVKKPYGAKAAG